MSHIEQSPVAHALHIYESRLGFKIKTDREFYSKLKINSKRFGLLHKGRLTPTIDELKRIALAFDIPITDLI